MTWNEPTARQKLDALLEKYNNLTTSGEYERQTERDVIQQFIVPFLGDVLGWPVNDPALFLYERSGEAGRPDMTLARPRPETVYIEAKKFGIIAELPKPEKYRMATALGPEDFPESGMVGDRSKEEQQAIDYAYNNGSKWAILTNFEHFRLYDARRDRLITVFERPKAYKDHFELLHDLTYEAIVGGSLDRLTLKTPRPEVDAKYLEFINEARETLARDIQNNPARNPWSLLPDGALDVVKVREVVQRYLDRLVLIRFAEDHAVIPADTLDNMVKLATSSIYAPGLDSIIDNVFREFDKRHNSALFALHLADTAEFSQTVLIDLVRKLYQARYRSFAADILGNTYEQYLGKRLALDANGDIRTADNLETRKKQGSYYTPQVLVRYLVERTLGRTLYGTEDGTPDGTPVPGETRQTAASIAHLRVLDPACGSGSFLIAAYEVLKNFYEAEIARVEQAMGDEAQRIAREGGSSMDIQIAVAPLRAERERLDDYPQIILEQHLYGVDLDPQAAELAVVNLMMRAMERRSSHTDLPLILNQNVKVGNSLVGVMPSDPRWEPLAPVLADLRRLRLDLAALTPGADHAPVEAAIAAAEAQIAAALAPETASFSDPARVRAFHWVAAFPEVFVDTTGKPLDNPGFTVVIGNPPWEILKPDLREFYAQFDERIESKLNRQQAEARIKELDAEDPQRAALFAAKNADATETAAYTRASAAYSRQDQGHASTHKLFTERAHRLLIHGGRLGLIIPSGIYTDLGTRDLRQMLLTEGRIEALIGLTNGARGGDVYFKDIHRSFKITLLNTCKGVVGDTIPTVFRIDPRGVPKPQEFAAFIRRPDIWMRFKSADIERFSPDSLSFMEFQTQHDYQIANKLYADHPLIGQTVEGVWNLKFTREFHMTDDRDLFNTAGVGLPLYQGKMLYQYDAFYAETEYWIKEESAQRRLLNKTGDWYRKARLAFRDISNGSNERTLITAVLPPNVFCAHKVPLVSIRDTQAVDSTMLFTAAILNSLTIDYLVRFRAGLSMTFFQLESLPLPRLTPGHPAFDALAAAAARLTCTRPVYAPLWEQVMGQPWSPDSGVTDPDARRRLRDEIDARVAHLFGLSWDEFAHILHTFPLVFPDNAVGQARLKALERAYVEMAD